MKLTKSTKKISKYTKINMLMVDLLSGTYGECTGTYLKCPGVYVDCSGNYTNC